ncbi:MAG: SBBP repeat-containing protein [Candidatus Cloacimonadaceae bacterium]|jgi:PKD repeat protein|nr:SBBP repeat-containing protein [Candidatus Cloacimonadota bacterium]MCB5259387.1 SBBP repeat-containing protein [Candidatus Cloacimonadota bacterium]MDY0127458.1 SBBP repeat-containing protein [Candidatus Cloacimonadaceae bacterium]
MKVLKIAIVSLIAMFLGFHLFAQTEDWLWANQAGGISYDYGQSIATDSNGNSYVTGSFEGTAVFGSTTLASSGQSDIFVAKMDSNGNWLWAKKAGGSSYDYGYGIAVDSSGNSYVTGNFSDSAVFGSTTLTSSGDYDIFVAKIDSNGIWLWAQKAGGSNYDYGYGIAVDSSGNSYVTGSFQSTATFGSTTINSSGNTDIFVAKIDSNGNWLWAQKAGGSNYDYGYGIAVDSSGNSYVTGKFFGTATFGSTTLTSSGYEDIFVAKIDSNGNCLWAQKAGGRSSDYGYGIAVDSSGNSYVTGSFLYTAHFGTTTLTSSSSGYGDIFVAKMDSSGNWLWAQKAGGSSSDYGYGITVDSSGNSYVTGYFQSTATFGSTTLTSSGASDNFVAKLDSTGSWLWVMKAGSCYSDYRSAIGMDSKGNIYVTGSFIGSFSFGTTSLTSSGNSDIFIAKYGDTSLQLLSPNGGEIWRASSQQTIYWDAESFPTPINIKFSYDGGASWFNLNTEPVNGSLGCFSTLALPVSSEQCLIRLESASDPDSWFDTSDGFFSLSTGNPPSLQLIAPQSTDLKLHEGRSYEITWLPNQVNSVNIDVSYDWGVNWYCIAENLPSNPATFNWTVADTLSTSCYLRISDSENPSIYDWSDNPFTIAKLDLLNPSGGDIYATGALRTISWDFGNISHVKLEYSINGGANWQQILSSLSASNTSYNWTVPAAISNSCMVRISDANFQNVSDQNAEYFSIRPQIVLQSPNGGEQMMSTSIYPILWNVTTDVSHVVLDYSSNGGQSWQSIMSQPYPASVGRFDWLVPAITTDQAKVRIRKYNENNITAISAGVFSIVSDPLAPLAEFSANLISGLEPLAVQFTDLSTPGTGGITAWQWDFGDGGTSSEQNPLHTYNQPGVYSVSLTVEGLFDLEDTEQKTDYITVIASVPEIELLSAASLHYGVVYLGDVSAVQSIEVKNSGGAALNITSVSYLAGTSAFSLIDTALPIVLAPDETAILNVTFAPLASGAVSDSIYIHSDADNLPVLAIGLRGTGEYVPPAAVTPPTVQILGNDAIITWEAVTETIYGSPIAPDGYIVLYNETPYEDANYYYFLNFVPETSYTHTFVALFRPSMFYRIVAVKFYRESEREAVAGLRSGEDRITWKVLKERMQGLHRNSGQ